MEGLGEALRTKGPWRPPPPTPEEAGRPMDLGHQRAAAAAPNRLWLADHQVCSRVRGLGLRRVRWTCPPGPCNQCWYSIASTGTPDALQKDVRWSSWGPASTTSGPPSPHVSTGTTTAGSTVGPERSAAYEQLQAVHGQPNPSGSLAENPPPDPGPVGCCGRNGGLVPARPDRGSGVAGSVGLCCRSCTGSHSHGMTRDAHGGPGAADLSGIPGRPHGEYGVARSGVERGPESRVPGPPPVLGIGFRAREVRRQSRGTRDRVRPRCLRTGTDALGC